MGYKWIGAVLIITGCSGCGFAIAAGKRREEQLLYQLVSVLQVIESDLQYRLTPLPELCRMAAGETKGILQAVFLNLYRELSWQKLPDAGSCMHAAIQRSGELPPRVRRLLGSWDIRWAGSICPDSSREFSRSVTDVRNPLEASEKTGMNVCAVIRRWESVPERHWPFC